MSKPTIKSLSEEIAFISKAREEDRRGFLDFRNKVISILGVDNQNDKIIQRLSQLKSMDFTFGERMEEKDKEIERLMYIIDRLICPCDLPDINSGEPSPFCASDFDKLKDICR